MPPVQSMAKMTNAALMLFKKREEYSGVTWTLLMYEEKMSITIPMLSIIPVDRIVPEVPEATP